MTTPKPITASKSDSILSQHKYGMQGAELAEWNAAMYASRAMAAARQQKMRLKEMARMVAVEGKVCPNPGTFNNPVKDVRCLLLESRAGGVRKVVI